MTYFSSLPQASDIILNIIFISSTVPIPDDKPAKTPVSKFENMQGIVTIEINTNKFV